MATLPKKSGEEVVPCGVLLVDKPAGPTSHDVVDRLRRFSGIERVGHGGTLDPLASGLLPLFLGEATKMSGFVQAHDKSYEFDMVLGVSTETHDSEGTVTRVCPVPENLSPASVGRVLSTFLGPRWQEPPMYSAVKQKGVPLYRLARKGMTVERPPREVFIHSLELTGLENGVLSLRTHCSKGTYVRVLAHEIGEKLGCGGHVSRLRRTAFGPFSVEEAVPLSSLETSWTKGDLEEALLGPDRVFRDLPSVRLYDHVRFRLQKGGTIPGVWIFQREGLFHSKDTIRILSRSGQILGLAHALLGREGSPDFPGGVPVARVDLLFRPLSPDGLVRPGGMMEEGQ